MDSSKRPVCVKKKNGWKFFCKKTTFDEKCFSPVQDFIDSGTHPGNWVRMTSSENSAVWQFSVDDKWFVFKEYLKRRRFDTFTSLFTGSRAHKAWQHGNELLERGFNTPEVLICGSQSLLFTPRRSFVLMKFFMHSIGLHTLLKSHFSIPLTPEKITLKRSIVRSTGRFIGKMHSKGIFHGDLRLDNILVDGWETGEPTFSLIDNERNKYFDKKHISNACRWKNLVQVNMVILPQITFTDRLRFFMAYLSENPGLNPDAKNLARRIYRKTKKRLSEKIPGIWEKL